MPVSTRAPACPWNAHGISYLTDEDIYDNPRTGHPTHTFFPVPWTKTYDVTLPPRPPFLPYSSLILSLLYSRKLCRLFFFFRFRTRGSYRSLLSFFRGGRKEFSVSSSLERIETNDRYSVMLIQVGYTIFSFRLVLLEFQSRRDIIKKGKKMRRKRMQ